MQLMSHRVNILERIAEIRPIEETTGEEEQFDFLPGRLMTYAVFTMRQLMETLTQTMLHTITVFIDPRKVVTESHVQRFGDVCRICMKTRASRPVHDN